jgi:hypothetical protein
MNDAQFTNRILKINQYQLREDGDKYEEKLNQIQEFLR